MNTLEILAQMTFKDNLAYINSPDLPRDEYLELDKALKLLGGKWKGGRTQAHVFPYDPAPVIRSVVEAGELPTNELDYFYTTDPIIDDMFSLIERLPEDAKILEPSAGTGHIAKRLKAKYPNSQLDLVELHPLNITLLKQAGFTPHEGDFLKWEPEGKYDLIVMNPPFNGKAGGYVEHINHAFGMLAEGGQLIAVVPGSYKTWKRPFLEFVCDYNGEWIDGGEFTNTRVKTTIVKVVKGEVWKRKPYNGTHNWYVWCAGIWALQDQKGYLDSERAIERSRKYGKIVDNEVKDLSEFNYLFDQVEDRANYLDEGLYLNKADRFTLANWIVDYLSE